MQEEVEKVVSMLQEQARTLSRYGMKKHLCVLPMYAGLLYKEQMRVFERMAPTVRKVNTSYSTWTCDEEINVMLVDNKRMLFSWSRSGFRWWLPRI